MQVSSKCLRIPGAGPGGTGLLGDNFRMNRIARRLGLALVFMLGAGAAHAQVVVSQVYGGGGNTGATLRSDFIELHNNGTTAVNLSGWSVQYASASGTSWTRTNLSGTIAAGGYFLVKQADGAGGTTNLPTPDTTGTIAMSGTAGKVALVNDQVSLSGACPVGGSVVDFVGYGGTANCSETAPTAAPSNTTAVLRAANGCTDTGNNSSDFATGTPNPRNSASAINACGVSSPLLSINDVSLTEGNSGTTLMTFTVSLSIPAGAGGVSFDIATANGTATSPSDFEAKSLTAQAIPAGSSNYSFSVTIYGDTTNEPNEGFFVNVTNITGALASRTQGLGSIQNDDVTVVQIHDIQGPGLTSPLNGAIVTTEGIVTALKFNNGFFLQTADADVDADPATSQGIFVFTSAAPPASAAVGNRVRVTGTVTEFTPATNLNQLPITELVSPTIVQLSSGNPLPAPVVLGTGEANADATPGTLERYEGMRVSVPEATVVEGSDGNITESTATSSSTGVFQVVLAGIARPFREPGIGVMDVFPIPAGKNPPFFDTNQERLMVRSRGQVGATAVALDAGATVTGMVGVLDYFGGTWALLPDAGTVAVAGGKTPVALADPAPTDVTIGGFNLLRFFDEVNDSNGAPTLTAAALDKRLTKTSLAICNYVKAPDILGVVEVENLRVLGLLAERINSTCARAPAYVPYLVQGNDPGGINVGFLVSTRDAGSTVPAARVEVIEVAQYGKATLFNNPDGSTSLLNDRPPLLLRATVHAANGGTYPVTVVVNHLRSLNGIDDTGAGSNGWPTEGDRVRNKRAQQARFLADLVQSRQVADANERIVLVGDFNAFEFNDGYADIMGIVRGDEVPEDQVVTWLASPITTPLVDGSDLIADATERYSYVFEGNAQTLDHVIVNEALLMDAQLASAKVEHARINADFGVHNFGVAGNAIRVSDHDPVRLALTVPAFASADLSVEASADASQVAAGTQVVFTALVKNNGPVNAATDVVLTASFNALVTPSALAPAGWTCDAAVQDLVGQTTTIRCATASIPNGDSAAIGFAVATDGLSSHLLEMEASVAGSSADPDASDNQASVQVIVGPAGDASLAWSVRNSSSLGLFTTLTLSNQGPDPIVGAEVRIDVAVPADATASVGPPSGWTCTRVTGTNASFVCRTTKTLRVGVNESFSVTLRPRRSFPAGQAFTLSATASSGTLDPNTGDNTATLVLP